ncbi:MAG: ZIP family metal transporter [Nocardioidaceae bacterium]
MFWSIPRRLLAALMAFGSGAMVAAVSSELFAPAFEATGVLVSGGALVAGALVYVVGSHLLDTRLGPAALGWALMLGTLLDGIPENTALGVGVSEGAGVVLLVAIMVGNVPEAVSSAAKMRDQHGLSHRFVLSLWLAAAVGLVAVTVLGGGLAAAGVSGTTIALVQAFAGGATIAVLADALMPEAYREGGWWTGLATAVGFVVSFALGG